MTSYGLFSTIFAITLLFYVSAVPRKEQGRRNNADNYELKYNIVGGNRADIKNYPYTAALIIRTGHQGSAIVLKNNWVLTSSWAVLDEDPETILVRTGSNSSILGGETSWVEKVIPHPNYTQLYLNDVALIKLKTPLKFNKYVQPIKIADSTPGEATMVTVTGFGVTNTSQEYTYGHDGWLRESITKVIPYEKCKTHYSSYKSFTNLSYCAAVTDTEGPCYFDYGSPLVYNGELVGVFSDSPVCNNPDFPAIYTDITQLKDWVHKTILRHSEPQDQ